MVTTRMRTLLVITVHGHELTVTEFLGRFYSGTTDVTTIVSTIIREA